MNSSYDPSKFVIEQTLHGYSDGHRLLASSCKLPKEADSLMLILSDLSGAGGGDKFDSYLSGYPLESAKRYALACTWPAQEMSRPGCVWTHTLLLHEEFLAEMNNPEECLTLFTRPGPMLNFENYQKAISIPEGFGARVRRTALLDIRTASIGSSLFQAVYGSDAPFAVLAVPRYSVTELPLLSLWRLQWPKLRKRFSFCGGARAVRTIEGRPMTVQATLDRDLRRLDRGSSPPAIVFYTHHSEAPFADWIDIAAAAYVSPEKDDLLKFLERIGDSIPGRTSLFRPTVVVYSILSRSVDVDTIAAELLDFIGSEFPNVASEPEFKSAFLGLNGVSGLPEITILRSLSETGLHAAFDSEYLKLRKRSASLWSSRSDAIHLMSRLLIHSDTVLSEDILSGLLDALPEDAIIALLDTEFSVLEALIRRCPQIAATPFYWESPMDRQSRAARALLAGGNRVHELMSSIIFASLEAGADPVFPSLVDVFGESSISVFLDWINASPERPANVPRGWKSELRMRPGRLLEWLSVTETAAMPTASFILSITDYAKVAENQNLVNVIGRYLPIIESTNPAHTVSIACEIFKVAINTEAKSGADLAASSLDTVYKAVVNSQLPDETWERLSKDLPEAAWWQDWDRGNRLRMAVVEQYRSERWPPASLVAITEDDELFEILVSELRYSWSGRRVLQAVIEQGNVCGRRKAILNGD